MSEFIDLDSAKERFMSNEGLYKRFLFELPERTLYEELGQALKEKNVKEAFETAHRMKGIIENLSLRLLDQKICDIVEVLRRDELPSQEMVTALDEAYRQSIDEIRNIKENNLPVF